MTQINMHESPKNSNSRVSACTLFPSDRLMLINEKSSSQVMRGGSQRPRGDSGCRKPSLRAGSRLGDVPTLGKFVVQSIERRKRVTLAAICTIFPESASFLPLLIDEYVRPIWQRINSSLKSPTAVLPEVCSFPVTPVPADWFSKDLPGSGFLVGKTYSGSWTIIDSDLVRNPSATCRQTPKPLLDLAVRLNEQSGTSASAVVVFDETEHRIVLLDMDWASDKIVITDLSDVKRKEFGEVTPGAISIAGIHDGNLILSTGQDIHVMHPDGKSWTVTNALTPASSDRRLPLSTQSVAPFIANQQIYFLSGGSLWRASKGGERNPVHRKDNVAYVSILFDRKSNLLVLTGFDTRVGVDIKYVTLYDIPGRFVISTSEIESPFAASIISTAVHPETSELLFVGRSDRFARYGSLCYSVPPLYN